MCSTSECGIGHGCLGKLERYSKYREEKEFVKKVAEKLDVAPSGSQAAVIQFSHDARVLIEFGETASWLGSNKLWIT